MSGHAARERVILFVAARTAAHEQLALDVECSTMDQSIRGSRHRDAFRLISKFAARLSDLQQALLDHTPDVVHIACHGSPGAELFLHADEDGTAPVPATALASIFDVLRDNLSLVVLAACSTSEQAAAICRSSGIAIGMRAQISDRAAIGFSASLYGALASGRSVQEAFKLGVAAVEAIDARQKDVPQLYARDGLDARTVRLVEEPRPPRRRPRGAAVLACFVFVLACILVAASGVIHPPSGATPSFTAAPSPVRGMVRFSSAGDRPGVFVMPRWSSTCVPPKLTDDSVEPVRTEGLGEARLAPFDLDELEVTNLEVAAWLNERPGAWQVTPDGLIQTRQASPVLIGHTAPGCAGGLTLTKEGRLRADPEAANQPATCITWHGASEYCRAHDKRLPLESEWELAARGMDGRSFPWGLELPRQDGVTFGRRDSAAAHPRDVGTSPQDVSPDGVRDLGGNAAEWVEDDRGAEGLKTIRGGSWASRTTCQLRSSACRRASAETSASDVGFRCASSVLHRGAMARSGR